MNQENLRTGAINTWCPGCGNFALQNALISALDELIQEGFTKENFVLVTGIGCHGKMADYLNLNSFYSLHGRAVPVATGIKLAQPKLIPIVCVGDGDVYSEGLEHLIFAAKRNSEIKVLVHNNRVFSLTTGQFTPTSPKGFISKSAPQGNIEEPLNPIELMLVSGASFVARGYVGRSGHLKNLIKKAILHHGFAFIDILQPCVVYFNTYNFYNQNIYELEEKELDNFSLALEKSRQWRYQNSGQIPIGLFYQKERPTFEEEILKE
ncbi:MAG: thiamine pyrophosphate-dependent enzyme [Patescibacteria group bacterium]|nr:thiamine pyrophosphate-dependent enzyme [Patescibacteria group bacterium]